LPIHNTIMSLPWSLKAKEKWRGYYHNFASMMLLLIQKCFIGVSHACCFGVLLGYHIVASMKLSWICYYFLLSPYRNLRAGLTEKEQPRRKERDRKIKTAKIYLKVVSQLQKDSQKQYLSFFYLDTKETKNQGWLKLTKKNSFSLKEKNSPKDGSNSFSFLTLQLISFVSSFLLKEKKQKFKTAIN